MLPCQIWRQVYEMKKNNRKVYEKMYRDDKKKKVKKEKVKFNKKWVLYFVIAAIAVVAISMAGSELGFINQGGLQSAVKRNASDAPVAYGEVLEQTEKMENGENICTLKVKIQANVTKTMTVNQNYHNVIQFVKNNKDTYDRIDYTAVADNSLGDQVEAVTFTVPGDTIWKIISGEADADNLEELVDNLYILPNLKEN